MKPPALDLARFTDMPFVVASRAELRRKGRLSVEAMGKKLLILWNKGDPRIYVDACAHMGLPLSYGSLEGDSLRCRYHGWSYSVQTGAVREQPTLTAPQPCSLERLGAMVRGGLVFGWLGDPEAESAVAAQLPSDVVEDFVLHRVEFACPFYLALFNAVDYAHFAEHSFYGAFYRLYRGLRGNAHVPGEPFHWEVTSEEEHALRFHLPEADRRLSLYPTCADFTDEGGVNRFQTYVTPLGPERTVYWECYQARSSNPLMRLAAKTVFKTVVVHLLDTEDREWTSLASSNFLAGENIHLSATDLPLGRHLSKFVLPRMKEEVSRESA